jgi:hypothetical protein
MICSLGENDHNWWNEVREVTNKEAHGAMKKERQVCARRRVGEPAVSEAFHVCGRREAHAIPNKTWHFCGRRRVGEAAVSS